MHICVGRWKPSTHPRPRPCSAVFPLKPSPLLKFQRQKDLEAPTFRRWPLVSGEKLEKSSLNIDRTEHHSSNPSPMLVKTANKNICVIRQTSQSLPLHFSVSQHKGECPWRYRRGFERSHQDARTGKWDRLASQSKPRPFRCECELCGGGRWPKLLRICWRIKIDR